MTVVRFAYISHGDTLVHNYSVHFCLLLLGEDRSSTKHVWISELVRIFLLVFEWLEGLPRIIKSSSVAKIQRQTKILSALEWWLSIASLKRIYF